MANFAKYSILVSFYGLLALVLGALSQAPAYRHSDPGSAYVVLSLSHSSGRVGECRKLSREEIADLGMNMRRTTSCPRERVPVVLELEMDGDVIYSVTALPTGFSSDGPVRIYKKFSVTAGNHRIGIKMRDTNRTSGYDWINEYQALLDEHEHLVIDFRSGQGIIFKQGKS